MTNLSLTLEILELLAKIIPVLAGIIGALVFSSPDKLPAFIRKRKYLYWPIAGAIFLIAGVSLFSIVNQIADFMSEEQQSEIVTQQEPAQRVATLPEVNLPEIKPFASPNNGNKSALSIADVKLGTPIDVAIKQIISRDHTCSEIKVVDPAVVPRRGITIFELDEVFQKPRAIQCYQGKNAYEHFYIFPDIYETGQNVFAIARFTSFDGLRLEDVRELLEIRYGPSGYPAYQPNYGEGLYWTEKAGKLTEHFLKENRNCFLYLPRAMRTDLNSRAILLKPGQEAPRVHLNSYELKGDCGVVLGGFTLKRGPQLWLFLADTTKVQAYKKHGAALVKKDEIEKLNEARKKVKF